MKTGGIISSFLEKECGVVMFKRKGVSWSQKGPFVERRGGCRAPALEGNEGNC